MYKIIESKSYIKALSNLKRSGDKAALDNLKIIVDKLSKGEKLPQKFKDHQLHGVMSDKRDCHIKGDLVLIYQILNNNLYLLDISNHANLFDSYNLLEGKRKKKRNKSAFGWFGSLNPNAGNPEYNAAFFNSTFSSDGSSGVRASGGLGEAIRDINNPKIQSFQDQINEMEGDLKVTLYDAKNGHNYGEEYLNELYTQNPSLCGKMLASIQILKIMKNKTSVKYSKYLQDGIYELRASVATNESRELYFFTSKSNEIIITNGFTKKTQKTPSNEIKKAKSLREEYLKN